MLRDFTATRLSGFGLAGPIARSRGPFTRAWQMAQQLRYDLVVTDLEMPRMNGFELIGRLRGDPQHGTTPVIIITSRTSPENRRRARELGVRSLVAKPVTRRKLLDALAPRAPS